MDFHSYPSIPSLCVQQARQMAVVVPERSLLEQLFQAVVNEAWSKAIAVIKAIAESGHGANCREEFSPGLVPRARKLIEAIRNPSSTGPNYADLTALLQECRSALLGEEGSIVSLRTAA